MDTSINNYELRIMILNLLQLSSPALPLGAYSYSEGLETLVETQVITDHSSLLQWLIQDLNYGAIRLEAALMVRAYRCVINQDYHQFSYWNQWSTAAKETSEFRQQSWQMGNTLIQLLVNLEKLHRLRLRTCYVVRIPRTASCLLEWTCYWLSVA